MLKICGLIGRNIEYSLSPKLHNEYYNVNKIPFEYKLFNIEEEDLEGFLKDAYKNNTVGLNITIPYKEKVLKYLTRIEYPANFIGAVNTIHVKEKELIGYNTDYFGFIESLKEESIEVENKIVLIIGNGGAAKAVYYAVKDLKAKEIDIAGRDIAKIEKDFIMVNNILNINNINSLYKYDIIINCTPLGNLNNDIMPIKLINFNRDLVIYDLNYVPNKSKILLEGEKNGLRIINGYKMLKAQAYYSINIWNSKA